MGLPIKLNEKSFFSRKTITVPAGQTLPVNVTGNNFLCKSASGTFNLSFDDSEFFAMETGLGFKMEQGDGFSVLNFQNPDPLNDLTIEYIAGRGDFNLIILQQRNPSTRIVRHSTTLANQATLEIEGTNAGQKRKQIIVTNLSATLDIILQDEDGDDFDTVFPRSKWTVETDAKVIIFNDSGAEVAVQVAETYYAS